MASAPLLTIADLLAPVPGDNPAGVPLDHDYTVVQDLDSARKDYEPHPEGPVPKKPEWDKIKRITIERLTDNSKDLRLAVRLTEALVKEHGPAGLRDGLALIRSMIEECWDRMYPLPDTEDGETMAVRGELLSNLIADPTAGLTFPLTVRSMPVVTIDGKPRSLYEKRLADEGREGLDYTREDFERATVPPNVGEDLQQAVAELDALDRILTEKLGGEAPNLTRLGDVMRECLQLVRHLGGEPAAPAEAGANGEAGAGTTGGGVSLSRAPQSREEAYRQLAQIANVLEQIEPHSPIPDLLRRAVELGKMPFRQLIREIVRDHNMLNEVSREFGIKQPPPPE